MTRSRCFLDAKRSVKAETCLCVVVSSRGRRRPPHPDRPRLETYKRALEPKRLVLFAGGHFDAYLKEFDVASGAARDWFLEHRSST